MNIKARLTLQFTSIVTSILVIASIAVYFFSSQYRESEFYGRLRDKANTTATLLIQVDEVDSSLLKIIDKNNLTTLKQENVVVYNYKNEQIYSSDENDQIKEDKQLLDKVRLEKEVWIKDGDYEVIGILFVDQYNRFVVLAGAYDKFGLRKMSNLRLVLFLVCLVSIIITFISGLFFSKRALKPVSEIIEGVNKITPDKLSTRIDEGNGHDELSLLAQTFNKMLGNLDEAFKLQKMFVANASHEIRTPLTAIKGQLEVALLSERKVEEYKQMSQSVLEDIISLTNIANNLLTLTQVSSEKGAKAFTSVRVDEVVWQVRDELSKLKPDCTIDVQFATLPEDEARMMIKGNAAFLKIALFNLVENACKFSNNDAASILLDFQEKEISLKVSNTGIGIKPDERAKIFEPFYRSRDMVNIKGHGIGLSLVYRIIKLHGGRINVVSQPNEKTEFTVFLPVR